MNRRSGRFRSDHNFHIFSHRFGQIRQGLPTVVQVGTGDTSQAEEKITKEVAELQAKVRAGEEEVGEMRGSLEALTGQLQAVRENCQRLEERLETQEEVQTRTQFEPPAMLEQAEAVQVDLDEVAKLRDRLETGLASMGSLLTAPLSVAFDAVRCEDFVGQDGWLPFTKLNTNLGEGMDIETGMFTVPTSGLYLFLLNVYGAPRDGVTLSIRQEASPPSRNFTPSQI